MDRYRIPELFRGAKDYKDDPRALELAQATFNEEGLYAAITEFAASWYATAKRPARIVDLCAATGLTAMRICRQVPVVSATLVDSDQRALEHAAQHFLDVPLEVRCEDAAGFVDPHPFDLVLANSAYHHIPDDRKVEFLKAARALVAEDGAILIGEHFLPPYRGLSEFREAVVFFYTQLLGELQNREELPSAVDVIRQSALYCWLGEYEYKVSWELFLDHCAVAGLGVERVSRIWQPDALRDSDTGTFAVWLRPRG
jgi:SAM-dependent methyltransferase